ncbi:hypothetical protein A2U01_0055358, partial [Trifolium medium]|nr:hypothetical protein [Trifolium medium]
MIAPVCRAKLVEMHLIHGMFAVHNLQRHEVASIAPLTAVRWEKPNFGWVKCNVDAAFFDVVGVTTLGACFCDKTDT